MSIEHGPVLSDLPADAETASPDTEYLARVYADLQYLMFCVTAQPPVAGPELDACVQRLGTTGPALARLAGELDETRIQRVVSEYLGEPVLDRLSGMAQREGSLVAMLQRRVDLFDQVVRRQRDAGPDVFFSDPPITSDDACVLAAATVVVSSAGGPLAFAAALLMASQAC
jgi:hypothetical protein